jgi:hypothetical protein
MTTEIKTKYTNISFNEDVSGPDVCLYVSVNFAWGQKADPMALLFAVTMDHFVEAEVRRRLAEELGVEPIKDIALEDTWLMVQGYSQDEKHLTVKVISIVKAAEAEFDRMLNYLPTGPS